MGSALQSVNFTISSGNRRQDCILRTSAVSKAFAMSYLKTHRSRIELIAQRRWADTLIENGVVYVDLKE